MFERQRIQLTALAFNLIVRGGLSLLVVLGGLVILKFQSIAEGWVLVLVVLDTLVLGIITIAAWKARR